MDYVERSLQSLEWPEFLNYYKNLCYSPAASAIAGSTAPPPQQLDSEKLLDLTAEAISLIQASNFAFLGKLNPLDSHFDLLNKKACLSTQELFDLFCLLSIGLETNAILRQKDKQNFAPKIIDNFSGLLDFSDIHSRISNILDEDGEIRENASEALEKLYRKLSKAKAKAQELIHRELKSAQKSNHAQDSYVDFREGKFVLPIRAEMQSEYRGTIVERSASKATVFMEPHSLRPINNELAQFDALIEEEIYRILRQISDELSGFTEDLLDLYFRLRDLDLTIARARVAKDLEGELKCTQPKFTNCFEIKDFFHPLLRKVIAENEIVTNDFLIENDTKSVLISGPNTGGKTVVLKALGIVCQMAKCGFFLPARDGAKIPYFAQILSHIGDEQSIELSLSSFSSSALIVKEIIEQADSSTLVLIDEIFASTDPKEGAALSAACMNALIDKGALTIVTTHFSELKSLAEENSRILNASMQFDQVEQIPKFKLILGVPGKSWALETATRFGFSPKIIEEARNRLGDTHQEVEALIDQLHRDESEVQKEVQQIKALKLNIEKEREELNATITKLREKVRTIRNDLHNEYAAKFRTTMRKAEELIEKYKGALKNSPKLHEEMTEARTALGDVNESFDSSFKNSIEEIVPEVKPQGESITLSSAPTRQPQKGDNIIVISSRIKGVLINEPTDEKALIQAGILKVRLSWEEIEFDDNQDSSKEKSQRQSNRKARANELISSECAPEINLIGLRVDEALTRVEEYLDQFSRSNRPSIRIIHGHGSGKLKRSIREFLRESAYGFIYRAGDDTEGGDGCTVVLENNS